MHDIPRINTSGYETENVHGTSAGYGTGYEVSPLSPSDRVSIGSYQPTLDERPSEGLLYSRDDQRQPYGNAIQSLYTTSQDQRSFGNPAKATRRQPVGSKAIIRRPAIKRDNRQRRRADQSAPDQPQYDVSEHTSGEGSQTYGDRGGPLAKSLYEINPSRIKPVTQYADNRRQAALFISTDSILGQRFEYAQPERTAQPIDEKLKTPEAKGLANVLKSLSQERYDQSAVIQGTENWNIKKERLSDNPKSAHVRIETTQYARTDLSKFLGFQVPDHYVIDRKDWDLIRKEYTDPSSGAAKMNDTTYNADWQYGN